MNKLTHYFPSTKVPARSGVYEVMTDAPGQHFAHFNETMNYWGSSAPSAELADSIEFRYERNASQHLPWRGIHDPGADGDANGAITI